MKVEIYYRKANEYNLHDKLQIRFKLVSSLSTANNIIQYKLVRFILVNHSSIEVYIHVYNNFKAYNIPFNEIKTVDIPDNIYNILVKEREKYYPHNSFFPIKDQFYKLSVLEQYLFPIRILEQLK